MFVRMLQILILFTCISAYGQEISNTSDIEVGTIWFKGKSTRLSNSAKHVLDSLILIIKNKPQLNVLATSYSKDFCDHCGVRSWDRSAAVFSYLVKHGIPEGKMSFINHQDGELNKVTLSFTTSSKINKTTPHPNLRKLKQ